LSEQETIILAQTEKIQALEA